MHCIIQCVDVANKWLHGKLSWEMLKIADEGKAEDRGRVELEKRKKSM